MPGVFVSTRKAGGLFLFLCVVALGVYFWQYLASASQGESGGVNEVVLANEDPPALAAPTTPLQPERVQFRHEPKRTGRPKGKARVLSGTVIDESGTPMRGATLMASPVRLLPMTSSRRRKEFLTTGVVGDDGGFRLDLTHLAREGDRAFLVVEDRGIAFVARFVTDISEGLVFRVNGPSHPTRTLAGKIKLTNYSENGGGWVVSTRHQLIGYGDFKGSLIRLDAYPLKYPEHLKTGDPVHIHVFTKDRSPVGGLRFANGAELQRQIGKGWVIDAPLRAIRVDSDRDGHSFHASRIEIAWDKGIPGDAPIGKLTVRDGRVHAHLAAGSYPVLGSTADGSRSMGILRIGGSADAAIEWSSRLTGDKSLDVSVTVLRNQSGSTRRLVLRCERLVENQLGSHRISVGNKLVTSDGKVTFEGLPSGRYHLTLRRYDYYKALVASRTVEVPGPPVQLTDKRVATICLDPESSINDSRWTHATLFLRTVSGEQWRQFDIKCSDVKSMFIAGLTPGKYEYRLAVNGRIGAGFLAVDSIEDLQVFRPPLVDPVGVTGSLEARPAGGRVCVMRNGKRSPFPWETEPVAANGSAFELSLHPEDAVSPKLGLLGSGKIHAIVPNGNGTYRIERN